MSSLNINPKLIKPIDIITGEETFMGYKEDGKWVYAKKINIGYLPNNSGKTISHGLTDINFLKFEARAFKDNDYITLPFSTPYNITYSVQCSLTNTSIYILTNRDLSNMIGFVTIFYTKK